MTKRLHRYIASTVSICILVACSSAQPAPVSIGYGATPVLPKPESKLIPTVNVADAKGWPAGQTPIAATGLTVNAFASGLDHPRWLYVLPNGDVLVAESNAPKRPDDGNGIKGFFMKRYMEKAGAGVPSANRISLLRDTNGDGIADEKTAYLTGLHSPFGMALVDDTLFVANTDGIVSFPYNSAAKQITANATPITDLPAGDINHHWTKNIIASPDGKKLYATVGSNSNIAENGLAAEQGRAAIWEVDIATGYKRLFAAGLRNPNGLAWNPDNGELWTAVNERDELGDNLVPDYVTTVKDGAFYGWPWSYYGQTVDTRVTPANPQMVARAISPDYALGSHTASLGIAFAEDETLGADYSNGLFVGQHGSWNRKPRSGYKVIFIPFTAGSPSGEPVDILSGFVAGDTAMGRPVDVGFAKDGALLVTDDVGNIIWRVTAK
ncbi:PQQ-dependent sugar dehydrogenase [Robiginitomaculum antarcticum]|uniref:PQQ-dependent sugar dehydrogenase n=1 Tax=Robiginitomaculum antarcticum TaxID=437507 RepID=UPI0003813CFF|nr:sorbosone dehydrogenase family protein [Robiginitomaculum antarcticum]